MPMLEWTSGADVLLRLNFDPPSLRVVGVECTHGYDFTLRLVLTEAGVSETFDFPPAVETVTKLIMGVFTFSSPRQNQYHPNFSTQFGPAPTG